MDKCEHYISGAGDDEHFLLDDAISREKNCARCRGKISCPNESREDIMNWGHNMNGSLFPFIDNRPLTTVIDDHSDNHEDSPLLINDNYTEPVESEFHCHDSQKKSEDEAAWKKLFSAAIFCFIFMAAELVGGYLAGSLAVMTDAAHLFSDFIGFVISLMAMWIGKKPPSKDMTFGYYRAEVVGALLSVLTLWLLAAVFSVLAIQRIYNEDYDIDANTMMIVSSLGLAVNIVMGAILYGVCHSHSHGMASAHTHSSANINVRAAAVHVIGDLLQSVGVLIAAVIIKFYPTAKMADPICTLVFSVIVVCTTLKIGKDSVWFLVEGSPINTNKLKMDLKKLASVKHVHNLHVWALSPGKNAVAAHLAVDKYCDRDLLLKKAVSIIQNQICFISCTVQIETFNIELTNSCQQCQTLQC